MKRQKKRRKKYSGKVGLILKILLLLFLISLFLIGGYLYFRYGRRILQMAKEAERMVEASNLETFKQTETSLIFDANGKVIAKLKGEKDLYYISYENLPKEAVDAIISIEDKKFYSHEGVDPKAILRASLAYVKNKGVITQGGSTITQQLARNIFLSFEESLERKVREVFIARELEKKYTKKEIMEFYLNNIYFANGYYGIQAAGFGYFGKDVFSLSLSQIAFLLAIPNSPNRYDPYVNKGETLRRRNRILAQMKEDGKIGEGEYEGAIKEEIKVKARKKRRSSYMETFAQDQAVKALMKKDGFYFRYSFTDKEAKEAYEEEFAKNYAAYQRMLFSGGYRIYTSLEPEKQRILQKTIDDGLAVSEEKSETGVYSLQGSAVSIDNETGRVVAVVGGRSQNFTGSTLNRAYQSHRQPGSSIKPLIVYTPAFERDLRPESIVRDEKIEKGPVNVDGRYSGDMTVIDAVAKSKNTIAWKLFLENNPARGIEKLLEMKFSEIEKEDYYPASSIGGMRRGVSALELCSAYSTIENKGIYREPDCIIKITDSANRTILEEGFEGIFSEERVYTEEASLMMTTCMMAVMTKGTGRPGRLSGMPSAGKTGTTNNYKDFWFAGFTKYYTTAIWVGYDIPRSLSSLPYSSRPVSLWKIYMEEIHKNLEVKELEAYKIPEKSQKEEEVKEEEEDEGEVEENEAEGNEEGTEENETGNQIEENKVKPEMTTSAEKKEETTEEMTPLPEEEEKEEEEVEDDGIYEEENMENMESIEEEDAEMEDDAFVEEGDLPSESMNP